jgi:hypothetical protein
MKNSTGAIHSRLTNARAKYTKKKIASKVRYDSWLLKWTKSSPDETENPPRITAATFRIGPGSKKYQEATLPPRIRMAAAAPAGSFFLSIVFPPYLLSYEPTLLGVNGARL